jgi:hypothetical protein
MNEFKEVRYFNDISSASNDASEIIASAKNLAMASMSRDFGYTGMANKFSMDGAEYLRKNDEVKKAILAFAGSQCGVKEITEKKHIINAFDNPTFVSIYNAIVSETLLGVITNTNASKIMALANIHEVDVGDSLTFEIETKSLPIAQRNSYTSNVVLTNSYSTTPVTITPKVYSTGTSIDYIRILTNSFDFGKEIARVAMSLLFAQFKLITSILFDSTNLTGTPLYQATFVAANYTKIISWLQALNNTSVKAFGTIPAFQSMGVVATTNFGFESQDEMIKNGFLGRAYGIDNISIDQSTDLSAPFADNTIASGDALMLVPNNKILLLSDTGDKPVKLVRENFIRVMSKDPKQGSLYRQEYTYTMSFDCGLASQAHYAIQGV